MIDAQEVKKYLKEKLGKLGFTVKYESDIFTSIEYKGVELISYLYNSKHYSGIQFKDHNNFAVASKPSENIGFYQQRVLEAVKEQIRKVIADKKQEAIVMNMRKGAKIV